MDPGILCKLSKKNNNSSFGYDMKADIWSLGAVCYELLVGVPPFDSQSMDELVLKVQEGSYKIPSELNLSKESISFINSMLQSEPRIRVDIEQLSQEDFLSIEPEHFTPVNQEKEKGNKYVQDNNFMMTIKNPLKESFLSMFNKLDEEPLPPMMEAPILPSIPLQEGPKEEQKTPFELSNDMTQYLQNAFDSMNKDCIFFEPMMIPIIPESNKKLSNVQV